jgi:hypothetical protein
MAGERAIQLQEDFVLARAKQKVRELKKLINPKYEIPPPLPKIGDISPPSVRIDAPEQDSIVYISGYDLLPSRSLMKVFLIDVSQAKHPVDGLLTINSDYQAVVNLSHLKEVEHSAKVKAGQVQVFVGTEFVGGVDVSRPRPVTGTTPVVPGEMTVWPELKRGDRELATRGGPTKAHAKAHMELRNNNTEVWAVGWMRVEEQQGDHTTAEKTQDALVYQCPARTRITTLRAGPEWDSGDVVVRGFEVPLFKGLAGDLIMRVDLYVDHDKDDIGSYTHADITFHQIEIDTVTDPED